MTGKLPRPSSTDTIASDEEDEKRLKKAHKEH